MNRAINLLPLITSRRELPPYKKPAASFLRFNRSGAGRRPAFSPEVVGRGGI